MENFEYLTPDRNLQKTTFSDGTAVTVNFSEHDITFDGTTFKAKEIMIEE